MHIAEGRSFDEGIEFYVKSTVISVKRQEGKVIVLKSNSSKLHDKKNRQKIYVSLLFAIITTLISKIPSMLKSPELQALFENSKIHILLALAVIWLLVLSYYFFESLTPAKVQSNKYHAAEHKVLNYTDKYNKAPESCEEIMEMSSISYGCGSTIIAVILILVTLCISGALFIPWLILKIIWFGISAFITLYLWANGKCNFLQKFVIVEPTYEEVEVAFIGIKEYLKVKQTIT